MRCPSCDHDDRADRRFCAECGGTLATSCPACGAAILPGEKFCGGCGAPLTAASQLATGAAAPSPDAETGERRQLTVLFCDLVGSTELSAQLDPEDLREVVREYQGAAAGAVERFGGHVAQYLGDGILAYFGYPEAHDDDAERALRERLGRSLAVRVGVHTGPVVVGEMGAGARRETLALGETTNVAARLEAAAAPDTVVASGTTVRLAPGIFVTEDLGALQLKGVPEPVPAQRVVQPSGVRSRLDVAAGRLTRFVGRDAELGTLVDRWERAADGEGQNVLVMGEAGVGKSRLAYQLRERLAATPHTWLECGASPYTEGTPFHPVIALVGQGLAFTATDAAAEKIEKIERGLRNLASPENVALLADFLGLPPPTPLTLNRTCSAGRPWRCWRSGISPSAPSSRSCCWSRTCTGATPRRWSCSDGSSPRAPRRACCSSPRPARSSRRPGRRART
jgi:class 3 adenylate cyclase